MILAFKEVFCKIVFFKVIVVFFIKMFLFKNNFLIVFLFRVFIFLYIESIFIFEIECKMNFYKMIFLKRVCYEFLNVFYIFCIFFLLNLILYYNLIC